MTLTSDVSRASPIFWVQVSTTEVSGGSELLMNRAVVVGNVAKNVVVAAAVVVAGKKPKRTGAAVDVDVDRFAARAAVPKALAPNEDIMPRIIRREKESRRWYLVDEKSFIETSRVE